MSEPIDPFKAPILPMILVDSIEKALEYYNKVLGFETTVAMPGPDSKTLVHAEIHMNANHIMIGKRDREMGQYRVRKATRWRPVRSRGNTLCLRPQTRRLLSKGQGWRCPDNR